MDCQQIEEDAKKLPTKAYGVFTQRRYEAAKKYDAAEHGEERSAVYQRDMIAALNEARE